MSPRYLLVVGSITDDRNGLLKLLSVRTGLAPTFSNRRIVAFASQSCGCIPVGQEGCILGYLFRRHGPAQQLADLSESEAASIAGSHGEALLSAFWGGYVAALADPDFIRVMRDPSGSFPCYFSPCADLVLLASDAELLAAATAGPVSIDLEEIGRQLFRAFVPAATTALANVRELLAGFALHVPGARDRQEPCWSPWDYVHDPQEEQAAAAERLSRIVRHSVQAWSSTCHPVLLSVSGGLDSSIVAACLAQAGVETVCLTMFTDDPSGDERAFARALCDHLGLPLIERPYRLEDIDITEPLAANLPRPRDRTQANAYERVHNAVASQIGAGAFMTGNGGDHVFGYSQSAAPVADRYLSDGIGEGMLTALLDVCRQTGCSIADALRQAWRLARSSPTYRVRPNPLFLKHGFLAGTTAADLHHPWLDSPPDALPGKAAHVATILRVQLNLEPSGGTGFPLFNPLVSQPVVETCLAVPTWEWRSGGRDRSLARRAFASDLPPTILNRRVKGTPGRFAARLLDHFRAPIRECLLGGKLAAYGIVDAAAVERALAGERPVPDLERVRLLELVNAEAWIAHWATRPQLSEPDQANVTGAGRGPHPFSACPTP
jgi:asparagine synthase (glutamine-hydrolysing)